MEKYKNYLENKFEMWQVIIALLCAAFVLVAIVVQMLTPVNFNELESHYTQLESIKQDITNMHKLKDADISIDEDGMTIKFNGKYHHLKAYFDENKNYINATVEDNRIGSNIFVTILVILFVGCFAYMATYLLLLALYIPILIHKIVEFVKKKWITKN